MTTERINQLIDELLDEILVTDDYKKKNVLVHLVNNLSKLKDYVEE